MERVHPVLPRCVRCATSPLGGVHRRRRCFALYSPFVSLEPVWTCLATMGIMDKLRGKASGSGAEPPRASAAAPQASAGGLPAP